MLFKKFLITILMVIAGSFNYGMNNDNSQKLKSIIKEIIENQIEVSKVQFEEIKDLLENKADPNFNKGLKPLIHYVMGLPKSDISILGLFLHHKAEPNSRDEHDRTPLHIAASRGNITTGTKQAKLLIEHKADIDVYDKNKNTPLIMAITTQSFWEKFKECSLIELLLDHNANPNIVDGITHQTPLHTLASDKNLTGIKLFLKYQGGFTMKQYTFGPTVLDVLESQNIFPGIRYLLKNPEDYTTLVCQYSNIDPLFNQAARTFLLVIKVFEKKNKAIIPKYLKLKILSLSYL